MQTKRTNWANIICDSDGRPYKIIVTDGDNTATISVTNSSIKTCKKTVRDIYDVKPGNILVTVMQGDSH